MLYTIKRSEKEIDKVLNEASEYVNQGETKYFDMSYEQGLREMFDWLTIDEPEESPME